jgi:DNA polymerase-3 subunit delta'
MLLMARQRWKQLAKGFGVSLADVLPEELRQLRPVQVLERSMAKGRLAHAILMYGESPQMLETIAHAVARQLLQTDLSPDKHPDCFLVRPVGKSRQIQIGKSERGEFPLNTIRRLVTDLQKTAHGGGAKIGIVYDADRMNSAATNAFLKTLEEPPRGTTLFLLTSRPYDLLDTIRSRCFHFHLPSSLESDAEDARWNDWLNDYREWLQAVSSGGLNRSKAASAIMTAYGLNFRFQELLSILTKEALETAKTALPEGTDADALVAFESGLSRGLRQRLYAGIESATHLYLREQLIHAPEESSRLVPALIRVTSELEKIAGLLEINLNEAAALEHFLLQSLRIYSRIAKK